MAANPSDKTDDDACYRTTQTGSRGIRFHKMEGKRNIFIRNGRSTPAYPDSVLSVGLAQLCQSDCQQDLPAPTL
jgi:hypothetical protein